MGTDPGAAAGRHARRWWWMAHRRGWGLRVVASLFFASCFFTGKAVVFLCKEIQRFFCPASTPNCVNSVPHLLVGSGRPGTTGQRVRLGLPPVTPFKRMYWAMRGVHHGLGAGPDFAHPVFTLGSGRPSVL
jgi:hypothetical protein